MHCSPSGRSEFRCGMSSNTADPRNRRYEAQNVFLKILESAPQGRRRLQSFFPKSGILLQGREFAARLRRAVKNICSDHLKKIFLQMSKYRKILLLRFLKICSKKCFPKIFCSEKYFQKNLKISKSRDFRKIFSPTKSCQKSLRIWEYLSLEKPSILAKKVFDFRPKFFFAYVEKCQNPLLIPYWNCGRNSFSRFWDLEQDPGICVSQRGASSMVKKYLEHAHQTLRIIQLYHVAVPYRI